MSAVFDAARQYRYRLERRTGLRQGGTCLFVMLNPSTADEIQNDPTIRRCMGFAAREGCAKLVVCNLYAYRATNPQALRGVSDPVGPENMAHLRRAALEADLVVAAWGGKHLGAKWPACVLTMLNAVGPVWVLGRTRNGDPIHPLYVAGNAPLSVLLPGPALEAAK